MWLGTTKVYLLLMSSMISLTNVQERNRSPLVPCLLWTLLQLEDIQQLNGFLFLVATRILSKELHCCKGKAPSFLDVQIFLKTGPLCSMLCICIRKHQKTWKFRPSHFVCIMHYTSQKLSISDAAWRFLLFLCALLCHAIFKSMKMLHNVAWQSLFLTAT